MRSPVRAAVAAACLTSIPLVTTSRADVPPASDLPQRIRAEAARVADELITIRRQIHMHPELAGEEVQTSALVAKRLRELGLDVTTDVGGHGVVGILRGGRPGPVVAYRADMDAFRSPIVGDPPYRSQVEGVKHVCGHDAHVAIGIGVAEVLTALRDEVPGTVKLLFQPAEESVEGARAMIADGALTNPAPEAIFALHTTPLQVGKIGCPAGVGLSGVQKFEIRVHGASDPEAAVSRVAEAVRTVSTVAPIGSPEDFATLLADIQREDSPYRDFRYVALTGVEEAEDGAILHGMLRVSSDDGYPEGEKRIQEAIAALDGDDLGVEVTFADGLQPNMHSDSRLVLDAEGPIEAVLGGGGVVPIRASIPYFGEDFAYFQQQVPGAMFFLGVANAEKGITAYNHLPDYDLDESALEIGTAAMSMVLLDYLGHR